MINLRPYQEDMVSIIMDAIPVDSYILLQAATGAGKTIFFCTLIQRLLKRWPNLRIAVLAHRGILVKQAGEKMLSVWPDCPIGIASTGVAKKVDVDSNVTIGTIQTLIKRITTTAPFDLIIIDEAHRLGPKNKKSQYRSFLETMFTYNKTTRVIGLTATPYRLGHGYIYGDVKKPEHDNWFPKLHYKIGIKDLQTLGFLCPYKAKEMVNIENDLKQVNISGDYNTKSLSEVMSKEVHVGSAVNAYQKNASDRKHVVVFCVTIDHAEIMAKAFKKVAIKAASIHYKMPNGQREMILREFEKGRIQVLINVMVLSEGWDCPETDCIIMCRPTKSPALYVQMVGRGLRPHPDKENVLILDLSNNCREHNDPNNPNIHIPGKKIKVLPAQKVCPNCKTLVAASAQECKECGYIFSKEIVEQNGPVTMRDVKWKTKSKPFIVKINDYSVMPHVSKSGNRMLKLTMYTEGIVPIPINEFLMFDEEMHPYAREKSRASWDRLVGTEAPESTDEALNRIGELQMSIPNQIEVIEDGRWLKVHDWRVEDGSIA